MKKILLALVMLVVSCAPAYAGVSDLSGYLTTDNHYDFYLATNDSTLGTPIGSSDGSMTWPGADWQTPEYWGVSLTSGVSNYLHVVAWDDLGPAGVLGQFTLNSSSFKFSNGTSSLLTNAADWKVRMGSFAGADLTTLTNEGANGDPTKPWYMANGAPIANISNDANWIWSNENGLGDGSNGQAPVYRYFSSKINAVPEPVSTVLFLLGGATLAVRRLRKNNAK